MKTGKYAKDGREMQVGDVVHFRCKNHPLSGKGVVFMGKEVDGLGEDPFRIRDTRIEMCIRDRVLLETGYKQIFLPNISPDTKENTCKEN